MYLHRTGRPLADSGVELTVLCRPGSRIAEACRGEGLAVRTYSPSPLAGLGAPALAGAVRDLGADLVHVHYSRDVVPAAAAVALAGRGRVVFTEHMGSRRAKADPYHAWGYARVDRVLSISQEVQRRNRACLPVPPEHVQLVYYGLDLDRFDPGPHQPRRAPLRSEFGLPADRTLVGMVARISKAKGHALLLEAFSRVAPDNPGADLVFAGDGAGEHGGEPALFAQLQARADQPDLAGRVHFTGFTPRVPEVTACMDVSCICSDDEAFGLTTIEAMAMARPVVASASGALPEIVEDGVTGRLYAARDAAALAAVLADLLADADQRDRLAAAARASVLERFSMERHIAQLRELYDEVLAAPPRG